KVNRDHLLALAIPEAKPPRVGYAEATVRVEECRARHATHRGLLRCSRATMLADAEMKMPGADVDRQVPVEHRQRWRGREAGFVGGSVDHGPRGDLRPVAAEDLRQQTLDDVAFHGNVVVLRDGAAGSLLHHACRHRAHGSAIRGGPYAVVREDRRRARTTWRRQSESAGPSARLRVTSATRPERGADRSVRSRP